VTLVVPAVEGICAGRRQKSALLEDAIRHLWTSAAEFLLRRSETPPEPPSDWRLDVEIKCRCADCLSLQAFARDAAALVCRFRVNKQRRSHLHGIIDTHRLDMTHVTERVGSPQTLVCTKDRRTFDRRMKQYREEIAANAQARETGAESRDSGSVRKDEGCGEACRQDSGPRVRFSTSTLAGEAFVPWLAAAGELAYSPDLPPERDYYFQYSWVLPAIFRTV
jgi:hypothetical protein